MYIYLSAIYQGMLWGIMGIGLYISFRILNYTDLTSEASFTIGAASVAVMIHSGVHPVLATFLSIIFGMLAGLVTGILTTYFEIPSLLASIITLTAMYSINLRIMGTPNLSFRGTETIFNYISQWIDDSFQVGVLIGLFFITICVLFLSYLFRTDFGQSMIATGDNSTMAESIGINTPAMIRFALMLANGIIALSGALVAQDNSFSDVQMGAGTVVSALASIVIGEIIIRKAIPVIGRLLTVVMGAIIYRIILVFALQLGFNSQDFKLVSAMILAIFLAFPAIKKKLQKRSAKEAV